MVSSKLALTSMGLFGKALSISNLLKEYTYAYTDWEGVDPGI